MSDRLKVYRSWMTRSAQARRVTVTSYDSRCDNGAVRLVSFMDYDLGYFDLETRVLEPLENPFGPKV